MQTERKNDTTLFFRKKRGVEKNPPRKGGEGEADTGAVDWVEGELASSDRGYQEKGREEWGGLQKKKD